MIWVFTFKPSTPILTHQIPWKHLETHHIDLVGASFNVGHNPFAQPTLKPWATFKNRLGLHLLNHLSHPRPKIMFSKGVTLSCVIFATFNHSCLNVIERLITYIFFTYGTSDSSSPFSRTPYLSFLCNCVILYISFLKDVRSMPKIQLVVCILELASTTSTTKLHSQT
jgi:hypothetical protein